MSLPKVFEKPPGMKDLLPAAVEKLRHIEHQVLACMQRWGYTQIMTPTLEYYDTVGLASSTANNKLFKLLDNRGTSLVLRSDMTAPIARVVASLLKDEPLPLRLSYHASVFRAIEEEAGRDSEFVQTGVELVGDASPEADAEMVALAIASLQAAGVKKFKIALGSVGFLNGLLASLLPGRETEQAELKEALQNRDFVGYRAALRRFNMNDKAYAELEGILRLRGGREICGQAEEITESATAKAALRHLCEVWAVLAAYGVCEHITIDLTMSGNFSYYTGMVMEGYAAGIGSPVLSGGRYDNLLTQFGRPAPATGFALETNRMMQVADIPAQSHIRALILYTADNREKAFQTAGELRSRGGYMVETLRVADKESAASAPNGGTGGQYAGKWYEEIWTFV
ncbi:MAG TPA: ATP phosphoribosyltransferase regulatory subunit [Bacilli bacterium]